MKGLVKIMCDICGHLPYLSRCPNHIVPKTSHYCSICGEGILNGEEYIERYEYETKCFDRGNELFEMERLGGSNV